MKPVVAAAMAAGIAAGAAALPWYTGYAAEKRFREYVAAENGDRSNPFTLTIERYDRGSFRSEAVTRVSARGDPTAAMWLASEVHHGPRPSVAWFAVRTIPQWDPSGQSVSHYYFGTEPAFVIETTSGFDGSHTATFTSPPFDKPLHALPGAYLAWGGANVRAVFTDDEHVRFDGEFPRIAAAGMGYKAEIAGLKLDGDWRIAGPRVDWTGETRLSIRTLAGLGPDSRAAVSNFTATTTQRALGPR